MNSDLSDDELWSLVDRGGKDLDEHLAKHPEDRPRVEKEQAQLKHVRDILTPPERPLPETIGPYRIVGRIGEGGQAWVYEGEQETVPRRVAVKVLKSGRFDEDSVKRFQREATALDLAKHASIPAIHDFAWTEEGLPYIAMEFVDGTPLTAYVREQGLSLRGRLRLFRRICTAVYHAHQRGVFHRDLKPSNILIDTEGNPRILDFGLARLTETEGLLATRQTKPGQIMGTLQYMSPEQAQGQHDAADALIDVYALGVMLYEVLTDQLPLDIDNENPSKALRDICEVEPPRPSTINPAVREDLADIPCKALDKEPSRRYQSVSELAEDIEHYLTDQPIRAHRPSLTYRFRKFARRNRALVAGVTVATVGLLLGVAGATWQAFRATHQRDRAVAAEEDRQQVMSFLLDDMLDAINPDRARGVDVTVRQVLDLASREVETEFADDPELEATFRETIGNTYHSLGLLDEAEPHLRQALKIRRDFLEEEPAKFTASSASLARLLTDKGNYDEAESVCQEGLTLLREHLGKEHVLVADCLAELAQVLDRRGDFKASAEHWREVLSMRRKLLGNEHVEVANALKELAWVLQSQGESAEAKRLHREAVDMLEGLLDHDDPEAIAALSEFAWLLELQGELTEAEELQGEVLKLRRARLGGAHPAVAETLSRLAGLLQRRGDFASAEGLLRDALEIQRKAFGEESLGVADSLSRLGRLLYAKGDHAEAETHLRSALEMRRKLLGEKHWQVAMDMGFLGSVLQEVGRLAEAEAMFQESLEIRREEFGDTHWQITESLCNLAGVKRAMRKYDEAEVLMREALAINRSKFPGDHFRVADVLRELANLLVDKGEYAEAEALLGEAGDMYARLFGAESADATYILADSGILLMKKGDPESVERAASVLRKLIDIRRRTLPEGHCLTAKAESMLCGALTKLGRYEEAEPLLRDSYPIVRDSLGPEDERVRDACVQLIDLYDAWEKPEEAARYRALLPEPADPTTQPAP